MRSGSILLATLCFAVGTAWAQIPQSEYAARRAALAGAIDSGVVVAFGAPEPPALWQPFRQLPAFRYLTSFDEPDAVLVLVKRSGALAEYVFTQAVDPRYQLYVGIPADSAAIARATGLVRRPRRALRALLDSLARAAARSALDVARGRTWGELHRVVAEHPLAAAPALDRLLALNLGPTPAGGSPTTVNVSHYAGYSFPVDASYGPSQRHVVDMADIDGAGGFILPTGQSGLPFSEHYDDQWPRWLKGGLWRIPLERAAADARAVHRLVLDPGRD